MAKRKRAKRLPPRLPMMSDQEHNYIRYKYKDSGGRSLRDTLHNQHGIFWFGTNTNLDPWIAAIEAIDKRNDKEALALSTSDRSEYFAACVLPLQKLLKSSRPMPPDARVYLADLFDRYHLKKKPGAQTVPAYKRTDAEMVMIFAIEAVHQLVNNGDKSIPVDKALELISKQHYVSKENLANAFAGRRGATRRFAKRRP